MDPRSPRPRRPLPPDDEDWAELEREVHRDWTRGRLAEALGRLSEEQREIVRLRFVDEWEADVVAEVTGRSPAEVRRIEREAIAALRARLLARPSPEGTEGPS